jgi:hypothetical protein
MSLRGTIMGGREVTIRGRITPDETIIPINTSLSGTIDLDGGARVLAGVIMPAAWTTASITFLVSLDGVTFQPLYYAGALHTIVAAGGAAASLTFALDPNVFAAWPYVRIRSGTAASPVNQVAARTLTLITRAP